MLLRYDVGGWLLLSLAAVAGRYLNAFAEVSEWWKQALQERAVPKNLAGDCSRKARSYLSVCCHMGRF